MQKAGKKLSYLPTPNMAGLFDEPIPQAPAPDATAPVISNLGTASVPSLLPTNELPAKQVASDVPARRPAMPLPRPESVVVPHDRPATVPVEPRVRVFAPTQSSPSKPPPAQPRSPAAPLAVSAPELAKPAKAIRPTPTTAQSVEIPEYAAPVSQRAAPAPRASRAPKPAPLTDTVRSKSVVSTGERIRRTLRIPKHFDKMLRDIAKQLGANLNSAILSVIEAEWHRRVAAKGRG